MDYFAYVSIVPSIILSLGIAKLLTGFARILDRNIRERTYWVHLLWGLNVFLYMVLNWWVLARWANWTQWNFFLNLFLLLTPTVTFLLSMILYPDTGVEDYREHFYANHRWFFAFAAALAPLDAVDTTLKGWDHFAAQGAIYPITIMLIFALCAVGAWTKNEKFHKFFAPFFLVYILTFISINLFTLA